MYKDIEQYRILHQNNSRYGDTANQYITYIVEYINKKQPKTIIDFGCGKGALKRVLKNKYSIQIDEYDPAIPEKHIIGKTQYDLLITTDVLEHLYEDEIETFFKEILKLEPKYMFHAICTRKADNVLPNGTNAHKTIKSKNWWIEKIGSIIPHNISTIDPDIKQTHTFILYAYE